jgi:CCR4-NOT transcriptional regulation complex NOT5 subunit
MTSSNRSSYIRVEDQNQSALNELFSVVNNPTQYRAQLLSKPFRDRGLPESFFQPPSSSTNNSLAKSAATSSNSIINEQQNAHRQHAKNQLSLPNIPSQSTTLLRTIINNNHVQGHLRTVSDTAVLDGQGSTMASTNSPLSQINSQVSLLPLPDGWEEKQTADGQAYYIE